MNEISPNRFVDLQVNGYVGVDFNDPQSTVEDVIRAAKAMASDGVVLALPTIITASPDAMIGCLENVVQAVKRDSLAAKMFRGIHVEGPFLSAVPGFIGAHPPEHAAQQDLHLLERLWQAAGGLLRIVTLAPEIDIQAKLTRFCIERGIVVSAGHTDASLEELDCCIEAGLGLFTHLGNGCPRNLDRHDNIIFRALSRADRLRFTLIADGFHVPQMLFGNLLRWIAVDRIAVVSDAISAAGLGPGEFRLGSRMVRVGPDRAARDASGEHFVGAASTMRDADHWLSESLQLSESLRRKLLYENPLAWARID